MESEIIYLQNFQDFFDNDYRDSDLFKHDPQTTNFCQKEFPTNSGKQYCKYLYDHKLGISFGFTDNDNKDCITEIFVYNKDKQFSKFSELKDPGKSGDDNIAANQPYKISMDWTNGNFVSYLGEPEKKTGGRAQPISQVYERLGLELNFDAYNWETSDSHLTYIVLYKPDDLAVKKCSFCGKSDQKTIKKCGKCMLVGYCTTDCQQKHWKSHKIYCSLSDK